MNSVPMKPLGHLAEAMVILPYRNTLQPRINPNEDEFSQKLQIIWRNDSSQEKLDHETIIVQKRISKLKAIVKEDSIQNIAQRKWEKIW